ncbi:PKD domain-containing protein [Flavobacterium flevense]|uniref:PKD domain-containing protein n=1 Tax=Flavobacterium flevense TaxID=983 RepID=A0A4Y4B1D6_9FLAO|nr:PKD domain-containing protein [Flavobacterium flevense]GEC72513.1 hypothetical protein FFL01_20520 [Flavobacterium flevense]SHM13505.1 PKD domain-containing protein [Flavobacterium flevense]
MKKNIKTIAFIAVSVLLISVSSCTEGSNLYDGLKDISLKPTANKLLITEGETITYTDSSLTVKSRKWTFEGGNITTSSDGVVTVTYPTASPSTGTGLQAINQGFSTTLQVTHDDNTTESHLFKVKVFRKVVPDFVASRTTEMFGNSIQFTDKTIDGQSSFDEARKDDTILWEFEGGTPATSNERNPKVIYNTPGKYAVKLTVKRSMPASTGTTTRVNYMNILAVPLCDETVNLVGCGNIGGEIAGLGDWIALGNAGENKIANLSVSTQRFTQGTGSLKYLYDEPGKPAFTNNIIKMENHPFTVTTAGSYKLSMDTFGEILSTGANKDYVFEISTPAVGTTNDANKLFFRTTGGSWFKASSTVTLAPGKYYIQIKMWNPGFDTNLKYNLFIDDIKVIKN